MSKEIEKEFSDIMRNKMTPEQFTEWFLQWIDPEMICEIAEGWDIEVKKESLEELREIIKDNK